MRTAAAIGALTAGVLAASPLGPAGALGREQGRHTAVQTPDQAVHALVRAHRTAAPPTRRQIARAVAAAERSGALWATINVCDSARYRNSVGVRGQMPALGFRATLSMTIRIQYWSRTKRAFVPIPGAAATTTESLGRQTTGLQQAGAIFPFRAHAGLLSATVTFAYQRDGQVIGRAQRQATAGHHNADYGSPPGYSAAQCAIR